MSYTTSETFLAEILDQLRDNKANDSKKVSQKLSDSFIYYSFNLNTS